MLASGSRLPAVACRRKEAAADLVEMPEEGLTSEALGSVLCPTPARMGSNTARDVPQSIAPQPVCLTRIGWASRALWLESPVGALGL